MTLTASTEQVQAGVARLEAEASRFAGKADHCRWAAVEGGAVKFHRFVARAWARVDALRRVEALARTGEEYHRIRDARIRAAKAVLAVE